MCTDQGYQAEAQGPVDCRRLTFRKPTDSIKVPLFGRGFENHFSMKGIIYCRVSSKEQIEGTSLESQQAACLEYAKSKNIEILKVFVEQGESAKFADRTQLLELIDFCRKNKNSIGALIVWKIDRFARNVADHFNMKATLGKYGVRIVSVTEPIDTNPEG